MIEIISSYLIILIITYLFAYIDADVLNNGYRFIDHTARFLLRSCVIIAISIDIKELFLYSATFYLLFDYCLNYLRGLPILYVGTTSKIDRLWKGNPLFQYIFKVTFFLTSLIFYICEVY